MFDYLDFVKFIFNINIFDGVRSSFTKNIKQHTFWAPKKLVWFAKFVFNHFSFVKNH
jgi:hypothetical protein